MKMVKTIPALPVQNIAKAAAFYTTKLGFTVKHQEATFAIVIRNDVEIHLWQSCDKSWKYRSLFLVLKPIYSGAESFLAGTASCRIQVEGIEELFSEYKMAGVLHSPDTVIEEQYWGDKEFAVVDLHRNLLTFYEPV